MTVICNQATSIKVSQSIFDQMQANLNRQKLLELSEKAFSIEEEILKEEKNYQRALVDNSRVSYLMSIREKIRGLHRKELLFCGAIEMRLKTFAGELLPSS